MLLYLICFFSAPLSSLLLKPCPNSLFSHPPLSQYGLGNESSVLGLLWRIKQHFFAAADEISDNVEGDDNNDNSDFNVSPTKQQFLTWLKHRVHFDYQNLRAFYMCLFILILCFLLSAPSPTSSYALPYHVLSFVLLHFVGQYPSDYLLGARYHRSCDRELFSQRSA